MKKGILAFALVFLLSGTIVANFAPTRDDKKPIVVDKVCYAQEIVEYETDESENEIQTAVEEDDKCESCATICVRGKSKVSLSPDRATIYAIIENLDEDMKASKDSNYSTFDQVINALENNGISEENISLENFNCCPSYDYSQGKTLQGYVTTTTFTVKVDEIKNLKTCVDVMTENGVSGIYNIKYEVSTMDAEYTNALTSAFENAKEKASKILSNDNLKLVKVREEMVFASNLCRAFSEVLSTEMLGKIEIEASIMAEFETICEETAI